MACNFNYIFKSEGLLNVTGNHMPCKCGIISEMVQDGGVVTADH